MVFSSLLFLFTFLPIFLILYGCVPRKYSNFILLVASLLFYAWGEPIYVGIMIFSIFLDYSCGLIIHYNRERPLFCKLGLCLSLLGNIGLLCFFKYSNFFIENINSALSSNIALLNLALPIGISFYTFQTMSYTIDLFKGKISVQKNLINFAAYVTMFPQLIAGPIVTYAHVEKELTKREISLERFGKGSIRFIEGLGKKVLLANTIGMLWETIRTTPLAELSTLSAWLGVIAFGLQLYFDFSGYSDMAIGLGHMLGFSFPENFNYPYISQSVTEFWRRWHITLGSWFREYVYIPLGGNRVPRPRFYANIFVVWFLTGFWHGAGWHFIVWGLFFAFLMVLERFFLLDWLSESPRFIRHFYLILMVLISWVFFSQDNLTHAISYLNIMFGAGTHLFDTSTWYLLSNYWVTLILAFLFSTPLMKQFKSRFPESVHYIFYVLVLVISTAYLVDATFNPFLYFRF